MAGDNPPRTYCFGELRGLASIEVSSHSTLRSITIDGKKRDIDLKLLKRGDQSFVP